MALPKELEQLPKTYERRVEDDEYDLGMAGVTGANLFVRGIGRYTARVAGRRRVNAVSIPETALRAPKATQAKYGLLHVVGKRPLQRVTVNEVPVGNRHCHVPAG
jgi:hypothetical protein